MRILNRKFLFLAVLLLSLQLSAQEKWTLNECITFAIKNNLQLHNADLNENLAITNYNQSKWNILPGIGGGADAGMNFGRSVDPNTNGIINTSFFNNSYYLSASVDLFRGFMLQNQIKYQKFRQEAAKNNKIGATDELAFSIMNAFYNVLFYEELLKIANEQKALSELNVKKTQILVTTGLKSPTDLLEVKANFEKEELFCVHTSNNLSTSWINLKKAMNLPTEKQISLGIPDNISEEVPAIEANIPELFVQHAAWSPFIQSYEMDYKSSLKNISINKAEYLPSIRLQAAYNTGFYQTNKDANNEVIAFSSQIQNNRRQFVGATMSIPIFGKNSVRFDVKRSKIASEQAKTKLDIAKQTLLYEMEGNYNELTASWKELQQSEKQLQADTLVFQAAQKKFNQGMINVVEFYVIKNRLAASAGEVLHSRLTYAMKKRIIDFYKGIRFWE
ncbi:MAG: TolC family protein [Mariniphaga sp.]